MASYSTKVKADIARWEAEGLIDPALSARLRDDVEARKGAGISFGAILAVLAAILLGTAVLLFIAANWELMPRLLRVGLLFALIAGGYGGGAVARLRESGGWSEALFLLAAVAFGASLALIGQMYHLSGDEAQAIAVWGIGTGLAAAVLRSPALTIGAVILAGVWMTMHGGFAGASASTTLGLLGALLVLWILSFWTITRPARSLILLVLLLHGVLRYLDQQDALLVVAMAATSMILFAVAILRPGATERVFALGNQLPYLALFGFLVSMALLQVSMADDLRIAAVAAAVTLGGTIVALLAGGRESRRTRHLAYAGFGAELVYIYVQYLGSMLGSASFFLLAGLVLALGASVIRRFEKRFAGATGAGTGS